MICFTSGLDLFQFTLPTSAHFRGWCLPVVDVNSGFVGSVRPAFHVINEGPQLRHHLMTTGIVEEHTRRHRFENLQDADEFSRLHGSGGDWLRHLRKPHISDGCSQHGGKVVGDQRPGDNSLDRLFANDKRPRRD